MVRVVLHQALTDLRAQRSWVGAWLALLLVTGAASLPVIIPKEEPLTWLLPLRTVMVFFVIAQYLLAMTMTARWFHTDHAVATTAFWMGRPLSRRTMLASKLADIFLWLLVPSVLVHLGLQLYAGLRLRDLPLAAAEITFRDALCLLPVAAVATLTRDLTRIILVAIVTLVLPLAICAIAFGKALGSRPLELPASKLLAAAVLSVAFALATLTYQYLRRRTVQALLLFVAGGVAAILTFATWETVLARENTPPLDPALRHEAITVAVKPLPPPSGRFAYASPTQPLRHVWGKIQVSGMPSPYLLRHVRADGRLTFADGRTAKATRPDGYEYGFLFGEQRWLDVVSQLTGARWWYSQDARDFQERVLTRRDETLLFIGRSEDVAAWDESGARYEGSLEFEAERLSVAARLSLNPGESRLVTDRRATIISSHLERTDCSVLVRYDYPRLLWSGRRDHGIPVGAKLLYQVVLVHPTRDLAVYARSNLTPDWNAGLGSILWPVFVQPVVASYLFDLGSDKDGTTQADREDWLRHGQLVLIGSEPAGRFTKQVSLPMKKRGE